jgi:tetratricopeptide (TPR) repeat protein
MRFRLQDDPHDKEAHQQLQRLLQDKYAFRAELVEYALWLRNNPDDYAAELEMRSTATAAQDDPEFAIAQDRYVLAHAKRSDDPDSYDSVEERMAFLLLKRTQYVEALRLLRHQTELRPTEHGAWEDLADAEVQAGLPSEAVAHYRNSIELDGSQEDPHSGLASAYYKLKDYRHAETELMAALAIYNSQYHGAAPSDSFHQFLKKMNEATKREPGLSSLHRKLAMVYESEGKTDKAIFEVDAASKTDDGFGDYFLKAAMLESAGQPDRAAAVRQQAHIAIATEMKHENMKSPELDDFSNPDVLFALDNDDETRSARKVIPLLESQLNSGRLKPMELLLLGQAYCAAGRIADCRREEETAFRLDNKLSSGRSEHELGLALLRGKYSEGGQEHLQRAYELDPQNTTYRMDYDRANNLP